MSSSPSSIAGGCRQVHHTESAGAEFHGVDGTSLFFSYHSCVLVTHILVSNCRQASVGPSEQTCCLLLGSTASKAFVVGKTGTMGLSLAVPFSVCLRFTLDEIASGSFSFRDPFDVFRSFYGVRVKCLVHGSSYLKRVLNFF